jgi:hypothetical protein
VVYETSINSPNVVWNTTSFHFLRELEVFSRVSQRRNLSSLSTFYFKSKPFIVTGNILMTSSLCFCVCNFFSFCSFIETVGMHAFRAKVFLTQWFPSLATAVSTVHQETLERYDVCFLLVFRRILAAGLGFIYKLWVCSPGVDLPDASVVFSIL